MAKRLLLLPKKKESRPNFAVFFNKMFFCKKCDEEKSFSKAHSKKVQLFEPENWGKHVAWPSNIFTIKCWETKFLIINWIFLYLIIKKCLRREFCWTLFRQFSFSFFSSHFLIELDFNFHKFVSFWFCWKEFCKLVKPLLIRIVSDLNFAVFLNGLRVYHPLFKSFCLFTSKIWKTGDNPIPPAPSSLRSSALNGITIVALSSQTGKHFVIKTSNYKDKQWARGRLFKRKALSRTFH